MREFPRQALAARRIERGQFGPSDIDALAARVADFHGHAPPGPSSGRFGTPVTVLEPALQNFRQILPQLTQAREKAALNSLNELTEREFASRRDAFVARQRQGFVRECHGDLHLGNVAVIDGRPVPFDCIEFNEELRWIDVMSEAGFLFMDLFDRIRSWSMRPFSNARSGTLSGPSRNAWMRRS